MSETTTPPTAEPEHPEWCDREVCDVRQDPQWSTDGDGWVGFHSTRPVDLDFGEPGGTVEVSVLQFRHGTGMEPARLSVQTGDWTRPDAGQAAELARVLTEHAELLTLIAEESDGARKS